jgi:16S rRNA processing protein RimM
VAEFPHRLGRVVRAHGLQGDLVVQVFRTRRVTPDQLRFRREVPPVPVELVCQDDTRHVLPVVGVRWTDPATFVVKLAGVDTREAADRLEDAFFDVNPTAAPKTVADDVDRVFGALVEDAESGQVLGEVGDIQDNGAQAVLVVEAPEGDEILIPFVDVFIAEVVPGAQPRVRVHLIPGLIEANRAAGASAD